tara:strand:- start:374 stop:577 length:204 start_codon:yes stop_codon:yes gene_type:complete
MGGCRPLLRNFGGLVEGTVGGEVENTHKKQRFSSARAHVTPKNGRAARERERISREDPRKPGNPQSR